MDDKANTLAKAEQGDDEYTVAAFSSKTFSRRDAKFATGSEVSAAAATYMESSDIARRRLQRQIADLQKQMKALETTGGAYDPKSSEV